MSDAQGAGGQGCPQCGSDREREAFAARMRAALEADDSGLLASFRCGMCRRLIVVTK